MQSIHYQPLATMTFLPALPSTTTSRDTTIAQVSQNILQSHRRKQANPRRAIKKSEATSIHSTISLSDPLWTEDQTARLLKAVKEHKGPKSREFWSKTARLFSNSRTSEACRKKYYKIKNALITQAAGTSSSEHS